MSAAATTASDGEAVWVSDYTTAGGVHVSGHWRRRTSPSTSPSPGTDASRGSGAGASTDSAAPGPTGVLTLSGAATGTSSDSTPGPRARPQQAGMATSTLGAGAAAVSPSPGAAAASGPAPAGPREVASRGGVAQDRETRLAAAEARLRAAQVAVGVSALRRRRGQPTDHTAALDERYAAQIALTSQRRAGTDPASAPPVAVSGPALVLPQDLPDRHTDAPGAAAEGDAGGGASDAGEAGGGGGAGRCPDCGQYAAAGHQCPTPVGLPVGDYSGLAKEDRVKAMVADLETSVKAVVESGQLRRWLDAMGSNGLSRWSANNRLLALVQILQRGGSLEEVHPMGFRQWETYDRTVSKGAKAVWILAPMTRKVVEDNADGTTTDRHRVVGFKGVPVFNVTDTHGAPMPEPPVRAAVGDVSPGTLDGLRERVRSAGYSYEESEIPGCQPATGLGTLGYTDPAFKRIVVDARLSEAQKASTIAHELGHVHCGHVDGDIQEYRQHRGRMETEAEMTAYLVNRTRGMTREQVDAFSPGYIAGWSQGDPGAIHAAVDKATRAHHAIIDGDWPTTNGDHP